MSSEGARFGIIKLSDGTVLKLRIAIIDVRETGFAPYGGGIDLSIKAIGGVATKEVSAELREKVQRRPIASDEGTQDGWEVMDIVEQDPAVEELEIDTSKGKQSVKVVAEVVMVGRNINYKNIHGEPLYWLSWVWKNSWKPKKEV